MNLFSVIGKKLGIIKDWSAWAAIFGGGDSSGENPTAENSLKLSTFWCGTRLITETVATLPGNVFKKKGLDREVASGHDMAELLLHSPNDEQTPVEFWEGRVAPLILDGNSYAEKRFIGDRVVSLLPMPFTQTAPFRDHVTNKLQYEFYDRGRREVLPAAKVFHIRAFGIDQDKGLSPIAFAKRSLGSALALERAAGNVYSRGMRASGIFKTPRMDAGQRADFYENYVKPFEGPAGEGKSIVLPPTFDWQATNINPKDAEMLLSRRFAVEDVCRWLGIPPILAGHAAEGQTMWGSGIEQIILGWLVLGLRAYLKRIESAVNTRLLTRADRMAGFFFEFNFEGLLRADSAARAALMGSLAQNGLRTRDELRRIDNYPGGMPGGDQLTAQSNLVPLGQLGAANANANIVRTALVNWLREEMKEAA